MERARTAALATLPPHVDLPEEVTLLRWPAEHARREQLCRRSAPRLLLVEHGAPPPRLVDDLEDWIRVPAGEVDLRARVDGLHERIARITGGEPELDDDGVLRVGRRWAALPPLEARLATALLDRLGAVVSRDALASAGWPHSAPGRNALDVHVLRLRRRIAPVGLVIRTVRSRGYLLELGPAPPSPDATSDSSQERVREA